MIAHNPADGILKVVDGHVDDVTERYMPKYEYKYIAI